MKIVSVDFQKLVTPSDLLCRHFFFFIIDAFNHLVMVCLYAAL